MNKAKIRIGLALLFVYVGLFAYIARFSSPMGDDYPNYNLLTLSSGIINSVIYYWNMLGSRFTTMYVIGLSNSLGIMDNYYVHSIMAIIFSLFSLYFAVTSILKDTKTSTKVFITLLLQSVWLATAIDLSYTLYWLSGVNYYWTCSVLIIEFALIVNIYKGIKPKVYLLLLGVLIFLNSGATELAAAYQIPMFVGAALITAASDNKKCAKYMLIMLLVALAGLALQLVSPGNINRINSILSLFGPNPAPNARNLLVTYRVGVIGGIISSFIFFTKQIIIYVVLLFMPIISERVKQPKFTEKMPFKFKIWHIVLFEILTVCCFQAIGGYSMGNALYPRAMSTVRFIMLAQWILFFVFLYRNEKFTEWIRRIRLYPYKEIIIFICLLTSTNFLLLKDDYSIAEEYRSQLSARKEYIKQQKALNNLDIVVPIIGVSPKLFAKDEIPHVDSPSNDYAYYHGLNSIREGFVLADDANADENRYEDEEIKIIKAKADAGDKDAELFLKSIGGDDEAKIKLIVSLAEKGSQDAQYQLARYFDSSDRLTSPFLPKNDAAALEYYFKLADQGHRKSQELLWMFYMGGLRTNRDFDIIMWGLKLVLFSY